MSEQEESGYGPRLIGYLALFFVCLGLFTFGFFRAQGSLGNPVQSASLYFQISFAVWILFYIVFGRRKGFVMGLLAWMGITFALFSGAQAGGYQQVIAVKKWETEFLNDLNSGAQDASGMPKVLNKKIELNSAFKGELGEVDRWVRSFANALITVNNDYVVEVEKTNWLNIFDPDRLEADLTLVESRMIIMQFKEVNQKFKARFEDEIFQQKVREIDDLKIDKKLKYELKTKVTESITQAYSKASAWKVMDSVMEKVERVVDLLSSKRERWSIQSGRVVFDNPNDMGHFNKLLRDVSQKAAYLQKLGTEIM